MHFINAFFHEALSYGFWWLAFVGIIFCAARFLPRFCIPLAFIVTAVLILTLDLIWIDGQIQSAQDAGTWNGAPDRDIVFIVGSLARILVVTMMLFPMALIASFLQHRRKRRGTASAPH